MFPLVRMFYTILYILAISSAVSCYSLSKLDYKHNPAVKLLREYIRIDTQGLKNTDLVVEFWKRQAAELNMHFSVFEPAGLPICVLTLKGRRPNLPSIMLNSHSDVVPVNDEQWTYSAFEGYIDKNGDMYGRGTQDTKSVAIQYIEAIRKIIHSNVTLERTVHLTIMPDEETGGHRGMVPFVETEEFKSLNIGFALDEGLTSSSNVMYATYWDKRPWQVEFDIRGRSGHGATTSDGSATESENMNYDSIGRGHNFISGRFIKLSLIKTVAMRTIPSGSGCNTTTLPKDHCNGARLSSFIRTIALTSSGLELQTLINLAMEYRNQQMNIARANDPLDYGSYTTTNINIIKGGTAVNVILSQVSVVIDMRLSTSTNVNDFQSMLDGWLAKLGTNSTIQYIRRVEYSAATAIDDSNPYWVAMSDTLKSLNITLTPIVCPATSDMVVVRGKGIPAIGFSTKTNMISKLHDVDEYISLDVFLKGIDVYVSLIKRLANLSE